MVKYLGTKQGLKQVRVAITLIPNVLINGAASSNVMVHESLNLA
jgi:hypothetical protein